MAGVHLSRHLFWVHLSRHLFCTKKEGTHPVRNRTDNSFRPYHSYSPPINTSLRLRFFICRTHTIDAYPSVQSQMATSSADDPTYCIAGSYGLYCIQYHE